MSSPTETNLKLAVLNVRSLSNKSFLINNLISSYNLDFMFLTETWLDKNTGNAVLTESAPPNYKLESETRENKKGGGVCAILHIIWLCTGCHLGCFHHLSMYPLKWS